jgi:hypothetical protein
MFLPEYFTGKKCAKKCCVLDVPVFSYPYNAAQNLSGDPGVRRCPSRFFLAYMFLLNSDKFKTV